MSTTERDITCISCPIGCRLRVGQDPQGTIRVTQNSCARGVTYGRQEYTMPVRMVTSSIRVIGGDAPLAAVRSAGPIPKQAIPAALRAIRAIAVQAPVAAGDILLPDLTETGVALLVSRGVECRLGGPA